jgi:hypothetical protein
LLVQRYHLPGSRGVELFFDPETFQHEATRFRLEIRLLGGAGYSADRLRMALREKFGDFKVVDGIRLPTSWTITLELPRDTSHWEISFDNVKHSEGPELNRSARW